jgi:N-acetylmuramoyl-L-alanine amidase
MIRVAVGVAVLAVVAPARAAPLTVVIDAGHGGSNTGAPARREGAFEKHVTLAIARALKRRLEREGARVVMTRERDRYLTLRERARRANQARGDCFISLHANASPDHGRRGVETYVLSRETADVEARRAAARVADPAARLVEELRLLEAHRASLGLGHAVQSHLVAMDGQDDRGLRQAGYDVLAGLEMPAVLVEVGFIDHPIEGAALLRPDVQRHIADAVADGILEHLASRQAARYAELAR